MTRLFDLNPLRAIALPNVGRIVPRGLTVVVGPNSAGKTQMLKDIQARMLGRARKSIVCSEIELERPDNLKSLLELLVEIGHIRRRVDPENSQRPYIDSMLPNLGEPGLEKWSLREHQIQDFFNNATDPSGLAGSQFFQHFGRSFVSSLFLERRLRLIDSVPGLNYEIDVPQNEIQALYLNEAAQDALNAEAIRVFDKALWVDNTVFQKLGLRVAPGPSLPPPEHRLRPERVQKYRHIEDEGDGFKSYVAVCMTLLLGRRSVCLLDEPELCLHPPQAFELGRFIGQHAASRNHTTFVATHSSHVLRGIVEATQDLQIIRLSRTGEGFTCTRVAQEIVRACIEKPSTKIETILDGLFAEAVTVVESEGDRLVYSAALEKIPADSRRDVHFVSVGGIGGIADTTHLYRSLSVPVCVIADLDLLRESDTFSSIVAAMASEQECSLVREASSGIIAQIKALGPIYSPDQLRKTLEQICSSNLDWSSSTQLRSIRGTLSDLRDGLSQTARLKLGLDGLQAGVIYHDLKALLGRCRAFGLFLVPVGQLEDWIPMLMTDGPSKRKKAEWANAAANKLRNTPYQEDDIWKFVGQMWSYQKHEAVRLARFPL